MRRVLAQFRLLPILVAAMTSLLFLHVEARADCTTNPASFNVVSHDITANPATSPSFCELCGTGVIRIVVTNTDTEPLTNLIVSENLGTSGLVYVANSTTVDSVPVADPDTSGYPIITWNAGQVPDLPGTTGPLFTPTTHVIEFRVERPAASSEGLVSDNRDILPSVSFDFCAWGTTTHTPLVADTLHLREPLPTIAKAGRNVDAAQTNYTPDVYGNVEDDVIWQINIANGGLATMQDMKFSDVMAGTNMTVNYACSSESLAEQIAITNNGGGPIPAGCVAASNNITDFDVNGEFGTTINVPPSGAVQIYLVGKINSACSLETNTASNLKWGCVGDTTGSGIIATSPGVSPPGITPADATATLSNFVDNGQLQIIQAVTGLNPGTPF